MPRVLSLLLAVIILLMGIAASIPLIREKAALKQEQLRLQAELDRERMTTVRLRSLVTSARDDPAVVERLAREKFGYARTGEVVFKFRDDLPPTHRPSGRGGGPGPTPSPR